MDYKLNEKQKAALKKLQKSFELKTLTYEEWRDKYGIVSRVKELGWHCYKKTLESDVDALINDCKYALTCEKQALQLLNQLAERDNEHAKFLGFREYEIIKVNMLKDYIRFGVTIRFKDNGEQRYFIETSLSYGLTSAERLVDYVNRTRTYSVAGGLDKEPDFIFHDYGFSSKSDMYSYKPESIFQF